MQHSSAAAHTSDAQAVPDGAWLLQKSGQALLQSQLSKSLNKFNVQHALMVRYVL
jgi:hypothetical protein